MRNATTWMPRKTTGGTWLAKSPNGMVISLWCGHPPDDDDDDQGHHREEAGEVGEGLDALESEDVGDHVESERGEEGGDGDPHGRLRWRGSGGTSGLSIACISDTSGRRRLSR